MKPLFFLLLYLIVAQLFSQTKSIVEAYNLRYLDSTASFHRQFEILATQSSPDEKIISNSFLILSYLKFKDAQRAYQYLRANEGLNYKQAGDEAKSYYYYARYRYKLYIDEPFQEDLLSSFRLFEKNKNYEFATYAATALSYQSDKVNRRLMEQSLKYAALSNDKDALVEALLCKASYYQELYRTNHSDSIRNLVLHSFQQCIEIDSSYTLLQKGNQAKIYLNYANFLALWQYPANRIFPLAKKAIEISKKYNILNIYRNTYGLIAMVLAQQNKYAEAEKSLLEGLNYMKTIPYTDINSQIQFYEFLKDVSAKEKDYEKYYRYDKEYQEIKKNQDIDNERQFMNKAIAKYELQNKDEAIGVLSQKNELKTILLLASILIVVLLAVVFWQNIRSHKTGRKLLESHNREIIKEKEQVQKELVSSVLHLEKKNEILYSLKNQLLQQNKERNATINASVFQSIDEGILIDDDFNRFKDNFNPIYPNFFNQLQEKANHHLTQLDLKYCAFILMKLSNKEIASQMNVEPKSIRMARYRIKQKLNLNKEEDLDTYIESLSKT